MGTEISKRERERKLYKMTWVVAFILPSYCNWETECIPMLLFA
jgi:hypothetical protein